jgi:hypothetical protein
MWFVRMALILIMAGICFLLFLGIKRNLKDLSEKKSKGIYAKYRNISSIVFGFFLIIFCVVTIIVKLINWLF